MIALLGDKPKKKKVPSYILKRRKRIAANKKKLNSYYPGKSIIIKNNNSTNNNTSIETKTLDDFSSAKIKSLTELKRRFEYESERLKRSMTSHFLNLSQLSIWYKEKQTEIIKTENDKDLKTYPPPPDIETEETNENNNDDQVKEWILKLAKQRYPEEVYNCLLNNWSFIYAAIKLKTNSESPGLNEISVKLAIEIMDQYCNSNGITTKDFSSNSVLDFLGIKLEWYHYALIGGAGILLLTFLFKK